MFFPGPNNNWNRKINNKQHSHWFWGNSKNRKGQWHGPISRRLSLWASVDESSSLSVRSIVRCFQCKQTNGTPMKTTTSRAMKRTAWNGSENKFNSLSIPMKNRSKLWRLEKKSTTVTTKVVDKRQQLWSWSWSYNPLIFRRFQVG